MPSNSTVKTVAQVEESKPSVHASSSYLQLLWDSFRIEVLKAQFTLTFPDLFKFLYLYCLYCWPLANISAIIISLGVCPLSSSYSKPLLPAGGSVLPFLAISSVCFALLFLSLLSWKHFHFPWNTGGKSTDSTMMHYFQWLMLVLLRLTVEIRPSKKKNPKVLSG